MSKIKDNLPKLNNHIDLRIINLPNQRKEHARAIITNYSYTHLERSLDIINESGIVKNKTIIEHKGALSKAKITGDEVSGSYYTELIQKKLSKAREWANNYPTVSAII